MDISGIISPRRSAFAPIAVGIASLVAAGVLVTSDPLGASGGNDSTFVPITPCRLFDTRPGDDNIGPRATPIGPGETFEIQVTGSNGDCVIPSDAAAIAVNATAVRATDTSYATFYPAGANRPLASSLNFAPGAAPTPNSIDVKLSNGGAMAVYNAFGQVHLLGDVTGYYSGQALARIDDEIATKADAATVYTKAEVDALLARLADRTYTKAEVDRLLVTDRVFAASIEGFTGDPLTVGPYTSQRLGLGTYQVVFDLLEYGIPTTVEPFVTTSSSCSGEPTIPQKLTTPSGERLSSVTIDVETVNFAGGLHDCTFEIFLRLVD